MRFEALQAGRVDLLIATVTAPEDRRSLAELSEPYFISASLVLVAQESRWDRLGPSQLSEPDQQAAAEAIRKAND